MDVVNSRGQVIHAGPDKSARASHRRLRLIARIQRPIQRRRADISTLDILSSLLHAKHSIRIEVNVIAIVLSCF